MSVAFLPGRTGAVPGAVAQKGALSGPDASTSARHAGVNGNGILVPTVPRVAPPCPDHAPGNRADQTMARATGSRRCRWSRLLFPESMRTRLAKMGRNGASGKKRDQSGVSSVSTKNQKSTLTPNIFARSYGASRSRPDSLSRQSKALLLIWKVDPTRRMSPRTVVPGPA